MTTPVRGWQTATNPLAAIEGRPVESDAELRIRQTRSVAKPSQSLWESMYAALWQLDGVRRVAGYGLPNCLRITVGDEASCRRVAHVIGQFMAERAEAG